MKVTKLSYFVIDLIFKYSFMPLPRSQTRIYQLLTSELTQHLLLGASIFIIIFCFFSIHAWYENVFLDAAAHPSWASFLVYFEDSTRLQQFVHIFAEAFIYTLVMGIPVYFCYFLVYKNNLYRRTLLNYMNEDKVRGWELYFFLIVSSIIAFAFTFPIYFFFKANLTIIESRIWYHTLVVIYLLTILTTAVSYQKERNEQLRSLERKERQEAIDRRKDAERELQFLKKQIRPHFLFNTLQNLQILAKKKSDELPHLMLELATLMRYLIYRTNTKMVMLEDELDFIQSYINLSKVQYRGTNLLSYNVTGDTDKQYKIAPMIILNIIENCFKHCNPTPNGKKIIDIHIKIQNNKLDLITQNTYKQNRVNEEDLNDKPKMSGLGLESAKRYLEYMYPDEYVLESTSDNHIFKMYLQIPLK